MKRLIVTTLFVVLMATLILALASMAFAGKKPPPPPPGGGCNCTDIYAPVICSNGVTYPNLCYATCAKATGCVPTGGAIQ